MVATIAANPAPGRAHGALLQGGRRIFYLTLKVLFLRLPSGMT